MPVAHARLGQAWCQVGVVAALVSVFSAAQATGEARPSAPSASVAFDYANPPRIRLVRRSTEPFDVDFPTLNDLPKTLSVDVMTAEEILDFQTSLFNRLKPGPDPVPSYADSFAPCLQWLFIRHSPAEPWLTVGVGQTIAKINGRFRYVDYWYRIPSRSEQVTGGRELAGYVGRGRVGIRNWMSRPSIEEMSRASVESDRAIGREPKKFGFVFSTNLLISSLFTVEGRSGEPPTAWEKLTGRSSLAVTGRDGPCTHLTAKCRRYVGKVERHADYNFFRPDSSRSDGFTSGRGVIEVEEGSYSDVAVEDFCPFTRGAMVQQRLNSRMSGGSNMKAYAIGDNPSLRNALKPIVEGKK